MLVPELRKLLEDYNETDLRVLIVEMYKAMPKGLREDKDIDTLLQDAQGFLKARKAQKRKEVEVDVHSLETEINQFVDYAHKQYYFAPNNVVHKKERPKWRFKVKAYIKDLQRVPLNDLEGKIATDLLEKLYCVLCFAMLAVTGLLILMMPLGPLGLNRRNYLNRLLFENLPWA